MAAIPAFDRNRRLDLAREPDLNIADEKGEDDMASVVERIALPVSPDHVWETDRRVWFTPRLASLYFES